MPLPPNSRLFEFTLERVLGQGSIGVTYLAHDNLLDEMVVIKEFLPQELVHREEKGRVLLNPGLEPRNFHWGMSRFLLEARLLTGLTHPGIVAARRAFVANGTAYLAADHQAGHNLVGLLEEIADRAGEPVNEAMLRRLLRDLGAGLDRVHRAGLVHRDIRPENILARPDGSFLLIDFGAARNALISPDGLSAYPWNSPYAAPEQFVPEAEHGPWTDIYALGMVLHWIVTGLHPVNAQERLDALTRNKADPLPPAAAMAKGRFPDALLAAIDWAVDLDPAARPSGAAQWLARVGEAAVLEPPWEWTEPKVRITPRHASLAERWSRCWLTALLALLLGATLTLGAVLLPSEGRERIPWWSMDGVPAPAGEEAVAVAEPMPGATRRFFRLTIETEPADARVRIMNILPRYIPGIRLVPGRYRVEISREGYRTREEIVSLAQEDLTLFFRLEPESAAPAPPATPPPARPPSREAAS